MPRKPPLLPPPATHPDEPPFACPEINKGWIPYIIGALRPMKYPEYWAGTLEENRQARQDVANLIHQLSIAGGCMEDNCCPDVPSTVTTLHRLSTDGTTLEMSVDDGVTWVPDNADPRSQVQTTPAPVPGIASTKCDAAENMVQGLKEAQELISNTAAAGGTLQEITLNVILAILSFLFLPPAGAALLVVLVAGLVRKFLDMGQENYDALFTEDNWDRVRCALYCGMDDDGKLSGAGMAETKRYIYRHIAGNNTPNGAAQNIVDVINFVGLPGLNFIAYTGQATGANCNACECDDCQISYDFRTLPFSWLFQGVHGTWVPETGWKSTYRTNDGTNTFYTAELEYIFGKPCTALGVDLEWLMADGSPGVQHAYFHTLRKVGEEMVWDSGYNLQPGTGSHHEAFPFANAGNPAYGFRFGVVNIDAPASHYLQKVEIGNF